MTDAPPRAASGPRILRVLRHPACCLFLLSTLLLLLAVGNGVLFGLKGSPGRALAVAALMVALGLAIYVAVVRGLERRPVRELALPTAGRELGLGLLGGAALYTACVLSLMVPGLFRVEGLNPASALLPALALALSSGVIEELLFRGALFRIVEDWLGSWIALGVSSLVFGLMHLANPAATVTGALFISVEAGVLLAAAYLLTRRLWLGIGFHFAWNYTQSGIFSGVVSGALTEPGLVRHTISGPSLLTGGAFGIEASLSAFVVCTATGLALLVSAVRRDRIMPPRWRRDARPDRPTPLAGDAT